MEKSSVYELRRQQRKPAKASASQTDANNHTYRTLVERWRSGHGGRRVLAVSRHQDGRQDGAFDALVMVGIDAHFFLFGGEWKVADLECLELVVTLQVGPAPDAAVDDMRQALAM